MHVKHKIVSANLSKELRKEYGKRNIPVRKGDNIKILRGEFKGKNGKIERVDLKKSRVIIEGIYRTKKDGTKISVYFNPSNLQIRNLNLDDKKRIKAVERKVMPKVENGEDKKKKEMNFKKLPKEKK